MSRVFAIALALLMVATSAPGQDPYPYPAGAPPAGPGADQAGGQSAPLPPDTPDPNDQQHGVARLGFLSGQVNLQHGLSAELVAAVVNAPVVVQDRLQTAPSSSAEVQLDGNTVVRMAENTDLGFADLTATGARLQTGAGTVLFHALRDPSLPVDIETPSIAIHPLGAADLRVSVTPNGPTQVTVRAGAADIYGPNGNQRLEAGRSVLVRSGANGPEFQEAAPPPRDSVDDWAAARDNEFLASSSAQYAGSDMAGTADLDQNGSWVNSQYGPAWQPQVAGEGWSPYSNGQWVDEPYYGWTWVDAAPWGWAPFHYGRWFVNGSLGWCWWPGSRGVRHAWGPAYVGFFGFSGNRGLGWVALAPYEGVHAWWGRGGYRGYGGYGQGTTEVYGGYRNAGFRGGALGITASSFGGWRGRFTPVPRQSLVGASLVRGALPGNGGGYRFGFSNRPAYSNPRLASVERSSFFQAPRYGGNVGSVGGAYRPGWNQNRPSGGSYGGGYSRPAAPARPPTPPSAGTRGYQSQGWQRFGDPRGMRESPAPGNRYTGAQPRSGENGWHQFGQPERQRPQNVSPRGPQPQQFRPSYGGSGISGSRSGGGGDRGGSRGGGGGGGGRHR